MNLWGKFIKKIMEKFLGNFVELTTCYEEPDAILGNNRQIKTTCVILHSVVPNQSFYLSNV